MTVSICETSIPAAAIASRAAASDIETTVSSGPAQRRDLMPERSWIHSSDESMASTISALGTTRSGRKPPTPQIRA
jgi:hypothetical protein